MNMFNFCMLVISLGLLSGYTDGCSFSDNFEDETTVASWSENSDTIMDAGKSKSSFVFLKTENLKHGVLFTLLNPQEGGAGFAGIKKDVKLDLTNCRTISLSLRNRGEYAGYEFCMRHKDEKGIVPAFCHYFMAPTVFDTLNFSIDDFHPYFEGKIVNYTALDKSDITQLSILTYGGAHLPKSLQQSGVSVLEIKSVKIY